MEMTITPAQCRAARERLGLTELELAQRAGIRHSAIIDFETQRRLVAKDSVQAIQRALEAAGVEFTDGDEPGVRMKQQGATIAATWKEPPA